jgi:hypothetical protein
VGEGRRQQAEAGHQGGHDDGAQAQHGAVEDGLGAGGAAAGDLDDLLDHDHAVLHRDAGHRDEAHRRRHRQVQAGQASPAKPPISVKGTIASTSMAGRMSRKAQNSSEKISPRVIGTMSLRRPWRAAGSRTGRPR